MGERTGAHKVLVGKSEGKRLTWKNWVEKWISEDTIKNGSVQ